MWTFKRRDGGVRMGVGVGSLQTIVNLPLKATKYFLMAL